MQMSELARDAQLQPIVREAVISLFDRGLPQSVAAACSAFARWIRAHSVLMNEAVELVQRPEWMLQEIARGFRVYGDCDDMAVLAATLLMGAGLNVQLVAVLSPDLSGDGHVFAEAYDAKSGAWCVCDPTTGRKPPAGWLRLEEVV